MKKLLISLMFLAVVAISQTPLLTVMADGMPSSPSPALKPVRHKATQNNYKCNCNFATATSTLNVNQLSYDVRSKMTLVISVMIEVLQKEIHQLQVDQN